MAVALMFFTDLIPKSIALTDPDYFARTFAPAAAAVEKALRIPVAVANVVAGGVFRRARLRAERLPLVTREELRTILTDTRGVTAAEVLERRMIRRIFRFGETTVAKVMVPAARVETLPAAATREDVVAALARSGFSRYPVMDADGGVNNVVVARDLLAAEPCAPIAWYLRAAVIVNPGESIETLLPRLSAQPAEMAVVRGAGAEMLGIVTPEDIMEEVVGEIEDEFGWGQKGLFRLGSGYAADGRLAIAYFNERMPAPLPAGNYVTLTGFLTARLGRFPATGDVYRWGPYNFKILKAGSRTVDLVGVDMAAAGGAAFSSTGSSPAS
jgi:CBS domain containing-hemolysin-like protein